jgi:hypothetical protein
LASPSPAFVVRTFPIRRGVECDAFAVDNPVTGRLEGDPANPLEPVWLRDGDGTRLSIVWPEGFRVRFEPAATLYDAAGRVAARAGDIVTFVQVSPDEVGGSVDDPYYAAGIVFDGCYPRER